MPETLSRRRRGQARLAAAWSRAAGAPLARRLRAVAVRRGVLEIEVLDARWEGIAETVAPDLAAQVAAAEPALGIRAFRIVRARGDQRRASPVRPLDDRATPLAEARTDPGSSGGRNSTAPDVREVARRYLARGRERGAGER